MFAIRIVNVDYYMSPPIPELDVMYSEFRGSSVNHVPVIRIFGSLTTGKKICLHVHGVFPYIYIPFDGTESVNSAMYQTATSLDKSLNVLLGQGSSSMQHIYKIVLVSGKPLYGYHAKEHQFLKLHFYNPLMIKKAVTLLETGSLAGKCYQPHEAHLPYVLQFMIDYNLHGMSFIKLSDIRFRANRESTDTNPELYLSKHIAKVSLCELEGDVSTEHILNRLEVAQNQLGINPGIAALWEDEKQRRRDKNIDSQISQCLSQSERSCVVTASHVLLKQALKQKLKAASEDSSVKIDQNISVYPAETPEYEDVMNASCISHTQSFINSSSLNDTLKDEMDTTLNESSAADMDLLELLCDVAEKEDVEEGSILSQAIKNPEESDGEEADLSLPLVADDPSCSVTSIPQLDGSTDEHVTSKNKRNKKRKGISKKGLDMPELKDIMKEPVIAFHGKSSKAALVPRKRSEEQSCPMKKNIGRKYTTTITRKPRRKINIVMLIKQIKKECNLNKLERGEPPKFRTLSDFKHSEDPPKNVEVAKVSFPTLTNSYSFEVPLVPISSTLSYEDLINSYTFLSALEQIGTQNKQQGSINRKGRKSLKVKGISDAFMVPPFSGSASKSKDSEERIVHEMPPAIYMHTSGPNISCLKEKMENNNQFNQYMSSSFTNEKLGGCKAIVQENRKFTLDENCNVDSSIQQISSENFKIPGRENSSVFDEKQLYLSKRRYMKIYKKLAVRQIMGMDGPNDSSSSDDDYSISSYKKCSSKGSVYSPLFNDTKHPTSQDMGFSDQTNLSPSLKSSRKKKRKVLRESIRRGSKALDATVVEESLECCFTPSRSKKISEFKHKRLEEVAITNERSDSKELFSSGDSVNVVSKVSALDNNSQSSDASKDKCSSTSLTSYQKPKLSDNLTLYEPKNRNLDTSSAGDHVWVPKYNTPTRLMIQETLQKYGIPEIRYLEPYYSNPEDVTGKVEIGNAVLKVPSKASLHFPAFQSNFNSVNISDAEYKSSKFFAFTESVYVIVTPVKLPPTAKEVQNSSQPKLKQVQLKKQKIKIKLPTSPESKEMSDDSISISPCTPEMESSQEPSSPVLGKKNKRTHSTKAKVNKSVIETLRKSVVHAQFHSQLNATNECQISAATLNNTNGFKLSLENLQTARALVEYQQLLTLIVEVHVQTRGDFKPDPQLDPIRAIFYGIIHDAPGSELNNSSGVFVVNSLLGEDLKDDLLKGTGVSCDVFYSDSEMCLINDFVKFIHKCDPDILTGYEIEMASWGYLIARGYVLGLNLPPQLSRIANLKSLGKIEKLDDDFRLPGRIVLDMWRLMRHEIAVQSYTFENVVYHILHKRVPLYTNKELSFWWEHKSYLYRHKTVNFYLFRVKAIIMLVEQLDLIGRTSELARLFGIQFFEVLSRGSQFRVESMMLRLAKPLNYVAVSPSVSQRAKMRAPEFLPLILEPESKFYADPVIVLDFQSLYPSMMIAYNYCFSTCVGRVEHLGKQAPFEFGATQLKISKLRIKKLLAKNKLNFSPCGVAFVTSDVRQGILPRMLEEILNTRLMVKKSMKQNKTNKTLQRVLHSRQLGLKLIANVTYGYTAANFSGRMPCVELGDSVVSKGRETLQRAIDLVDKTTDWGARVVYGDTDSLFVLVSGKSRADAFEIGAKIADAVTKDNPRPVKLKLEKVYQPCILQTKKRYVGYMYESAEQTVPEFDAKGIETVRRDGCPAASKMLEKCLKMLFDNCDVSLVKQYVLRQFHKILLGRITIQDLTFAKEYRGASGYRPGACVPALELARKWTAVDKRNEPRRGQRVPYVIVNGPPGLPLIRLVRSPLELLADNSLRPNALYYITRVIIPPINRCFNLIGVDLNVWFNEMPRKQFQYLPVSSPMKKSTISQFFLTTCCAVCGQQSQNGMCTSCVEQPQVSTVILHEKVRIWEQHYVEINLICKSCCGDQLYSGCVSLDCPVLYQRHQACCDLQQSDYVRQILSKSFDV